MEHSGFSWIYLIIFLAIPLARIIPRILARYGIGKSAPRTIQEKPFQSQSNDYSPQKPSMESSPEPQMKPFKPQTKNNLVLGVLNRGSKTFENIKKNTGLENEELDTILEDLEKNGLMKVIHKQGMLGAKVEMVPTDKGFKEYYS